VFSIARGVAHRNTIFVITTNVKTKVASFGQGCPGSDNARRLR
jgi:hypothetical protein